MNVQQRLHDPPDGGSRLLVDAEHEDPAVAARWVATDVAKAAIQRDQKPSGVGGRLDDHGVHGTGQAFADDGVGVVSGGDEHCQHGPRDVLVELDPHSIGRGINWSRARNAPYAAAARIPASVTLGYSVRISVLVMPTARQSRMTLTGTRVPARTA